MPLRFLMLLALIAQLPSSGTALTATATPATAAPATQPAPQPTTRPSVLLLTADAATLHGATLASTRPGHTGATYATGFLADGDSVSWQVTLPEDRLYLAEIRYSAPQHKGYQLCVNGVGRDDLFPATGNAFATHSAGLIRLHQGLNTLEIRKGWGFYDIDRLELIPSDIASWSKPSVTLADPNATPEAKALLARLLESYGSRTLSGVVSPTDAKHVLDHAGVLPAIMGGDLIDYSPSRVERNASNPNPYFPDPTDRLLANARDGYTLTLMWHWNAPKDLIDAMLEKDGQKIDARWYRGFYTNATTFDLSAALADPSSEDYRLLLRDVDAIAEQLKRYADAKIPILFRPLHEADGGWFWWGAKGPQPFKQLWSLLFHRLTEHHNLHNLIWVYTGTANWDWYPPDSQFDIIGVDAYPKDLRDPLSALYTAIYSRYGDRKLLALTEFGGVPDLAAMQDLGVHWAYFASWNGDLGPQRYAPPELTRLYRDPVILNRQ